MKYPLADYALTPDVAIIDPQFVMSLPKSATADTGMDVLTHAIEAYTSTLASDYTDGLAMQAIEMVFEYLPRAYQNGAADKEAREKMHNASCIAGMAFTNAFLGLNHSMAHKLGGEYHIPHGRANAILLPYIVAYNGQKPTKFAIFPKYETFVADKNLPRLRSISALRAKPQRRALRTLCRQSRICAQASTCPAPSRSAALTRRYSSTTCRALRTTRTPTSAPPPTRAIRWCLRLSSSIQTLITADNPRTCILF